MPDSNWRKKLDFGVVLAVCSLLVVIPIAGLMLSEYAKVHRTNAAYQQNAEKDRNAASEEISKSCFNADFTIFSKCISEKIATYYKQQATNEDLQAQQNMAYWAEALFFLGIFQLGLSAAGIYFIWHSLELNRSAVGAALESNAVAREIGRAEVRAYISIRSAEIFFFERVAMPFVKIVALNNGSSPARNFVWTPEIRYLDNERVRETSKAGPDWPASPGIDVYPSKPVEPTFAAHDFDLVDKIASWRPVPKFVGISVIIQFMWHDEFKDVHFDEASFIGVAERGRVTKAKDRPLQTSAWKCDLTPIAKGEIWAGVSVNLGRKKKPNNAKRKN